MTDTNTAAAHYGDPCLHCETAMEVVESGPCPSRKENRVGERCDYIMSQADLDGLMEAINSARNVSLVAINAGMPVSPQAAANQAWAALGRRLGFDEMTVRPGATEREFSAVSR